MRLGLLGPCVSDDGSLERAARFLHDRVSVDRVVYLGVDQALDAVVARWAGELVGGDPGEAALWLRAAQRCARGTPAELDAFLAAERQRRELLRFESLPDATTRVVELLHGKVCVMLHDKAQLDEEDMLPASFLVYGSSKQPLVKQVGTRWFLAPGTLEEFGIMTLAELDDGVELTLFDRLGQEVRRERLALASGAKMRVSGQG